jgi:hypothetical protein
LENRHPQKLQHILHLYNRKEKSVVQNITGDFFINSIMKNIKKALDKKINKEYSLSRNDLNVLFLLQNDLGSNRLPFVANIFKNEKDERIIVS